MSQNRELEFIEYKPGEWYYLLEDSNGYKDAWDWHEQAKAYGPFESYEKACYHQYELSRISTPGATITDHNSLRVTPAIHNLLASVTLEKAW